MNALIIKSPWIDMILDGRKTLEIRGSNTNIRGKIGLIKSGTGLIYGTVYLVDSRKLSYGEFRTSKAMHCIPVDQCAAPPYKQIHGWALSNHSRFETPIPYKHPQGAVIWVRVGDIVESYST